MTVASKQGKLANRNTDVRTLETGFLRAAPLAVTAFASGPSPLRLPNLA
jgi:hypothetical protein